MSKPFNGFDPAKPPDSADFARDSAACGKLEGPAPGAGREIAQAEEGYRMTIQFEIPHDIGQELGSNGADLNGEAREASFVELYRQNRITHHQLAEALRLSRMRPRASSSGTRSRRASRWRKCGPRPPPCGI